jgi:hypothetical protein
LSDVERGELRKSQRAARGSASVQHQIALLVTAQRGIPIPPLAGAAHDLRAARAAVAECPGGRDSYLRHRQCVSELRRALAVYISALERDDLPVASKLRQEFTLLGLVEEPSRAYGSTWPVRGN